MPDTLKILVVDDDVHSRRILSDVVSQVADTAVVAAANGRMALAKLRQECADLILLDVDMPEMDGLETLEKIRAAHGAASVVMVTEPDFSDADRIVRALEMGAMDALTIKRDVSQEAVAREIRLPLLAILGLVRSRKNMKMITEFVEGRIATNIAAPSCDRQPPTNKKEDKLKIDPVQPTAPLIVPAVRCLPKNVEAVTIAVSTGGPSALAELIPMLPGDLGVPVFVVQHMPEKLTASLAASLGKKAHLTVCEGIDNALVKPNVVYIAPGGKHMVVRRDKNQASQSIARYIGLNNDPPENSCRPAADVLFRSLAQVYEGDVVSVVMTGMGSDGKKGVQALKQKRCYCMTQTQDTCAVYGMPRSVDEANLSDERVPLDRLASRIISLVHGTGQ